MSGTGDVGQDAQTKTSEEGDKENLVMNGVDKDDDQSNSNELSQDGSKNEPQKTLKDESQIRSNSDGNPVLGDNLDPAVKEETSRTNCNHEHSQEQNETDKTEEGNSSENKTETEEKEEFMDILGNGTLLKKVVEKGSGNRPQMGEEVIIKYVPEIPELETVLPEEHLEFVLGDGDVVQALDLAVALMNVGETAIIISGYKYMYGELGLQPDIPPRSNFKLTVELLTNKGPLDYPAMDFGTRFSLAKKKKDRGNYLLVKRKEYFPALNSYTKASKIVDPTLGCVFNNVSPEKLQELLEFRAIVHCNASLANFKLESFDAAEKSAQEACLLWPSYSKAHWRLAQAQEKLGKLEETIKNYKLALKFDTNNTNSKLFHGELERLTKILKKSKASEKEMYSKMFWGSNPPNMDNKPILKRKEESLGSWVWKTGVTVAGAGLVGLASIGIYKYINH
ncbi:peptidyl-prolyl cis-trans isomerase FKBP8-like [Ruditapes philippinarum]|uniref:peptidyl-prolyl cis-trans isomerase FKBP8-like n=1 Tax=Ruditapes philippinarum TaxID=129788 RepID=UPI00295BAC51|nr:peptidyl-prolyl cis-trans isomerase FKBP8-like [Ruditapes philippinarum]